MRRGSSTCRLDIDIMPARCLSNSESGQTPASSSFLGDLVGQPRRRRAAAAPSSCGGSTVVVRRQHFGQQQQFFDKTVKSKLKKGYQPA